MAIRLRPIDGHGMVALCAARSIPKPGDIYLDDECHHALAVKFSLDFASEGLMISPHAHSSDVAVIEREESNNPNRAAWDLTFGPESPEPAPAEPSPCGTTTAKKHPDCVATMCGVHDCGHDGPCYINAAFARPE